MAAAAVLKNLKIAISQPQLGRFGRNLARSCSSKFLKSKMAAAAILKNRHISAAFQPILTKFGMVRHFEHLDRPDP